MIIRNVCAIVCSVIFSLPAFAFSVVIDAGHGGSDKGAVRGGIQESQITLELAQKLAEVLKRDSRLRVLLTRTTDKYLSLDDRTDFASRKGDLLISLHVNSSDNPNIRGKEVYFQNQLTADDESIFLASRENESRKKQENEPRSIDIQQLNATNLNPDVQAIVEDLKRNNAFRLSARLAKAIHKNWTGNKTNKHKAIRQAPFFVISNMTIPAALIEVGYLTNPEEARDLLTPEYQEKIAQGIYKAVLEFKDFMDNPSLSKLD